MVQIVLQLHNKVDQSGRISEEEEQTKERKKERKKEIKQVNSLFGDILFLFCISNFINNNMLLSFELSYQPNFWTESIVA